MQSENDLPTLVRFEDLRQRGIVTTWQGQDLGLAHHAGHGIDDRHLLARVVDKQLVASSMVLAHHRREPPLELTEEIAEARVAVTVGVGLAVLLPQHRQIDAGSLSLAHERAPVRLVPPTQPWSEAAATEETLLEHRVGDLGAERPIKPRRRRSLDRGPLNPL
jgi:hypothetical protein